MPARFGSRPPDTRTPCLAQWGGGTIVVPSTSPMSLAMQPNPLFRMATARAPWTALFVACTASLTGCGSSPSPAPAPVASPTPTPAPAPAPAPVPAPAPGPELLQNGGFEAPTTVDGTLNRITPTFWTGGAAISNPDAAGGMAGNPFTWPQAIEGVQYADIGNTPATPLRQSFTVTTAATYRIAWQDNTGLNIIVGFRTSPYLVTVTDGASQTVVSLNFEAWRATGDWAARTTDHALTAGTYTLTFTSQNQPNGTDTLIDAVSVRSVP